MEGLLEDLSLGIRSESTYREGIPDGTNCISKAEEMQSVLESVRCKVTLLFLLLLILTMERKWFRNLKQASENFD